MRKARALAERDGSAKTQQTAARYGQFVTLRGGLRTLVEALVHKLPAQAIRLRTPVMQVERHATNRWTVKTAPGAPLEHFDGVLIAAHAPQAAPLLSGVDAELSRELSRIEYASSAVVTLVYHRQDIDHPLDGFGLVVPAIERRPIVAASFLTVKFPGHGPPGRAIIRVFSGGVLQPGMIDREDHELIAIAKQQMAELIGANGEPIETHVMRWRDAMPQYHVGHVACVEKIESELRCTADWNLPATPIAASASRKVSTAAAKPPSDWRKHWRRRLGQRPTGVTIHRTSGGTLSQPTASGVGRRRFR